MELSTYSRRCPSPEGRYSQAGLSLPLDGQPLPGWVEGDTEVQGGLDTR